MNRPATWLVLATLLSGFVTAYPSSRFFSTFSFGKQSAGVAQTYAPGILLVGLASQPNQAVVTSLESELNAQTVAKLPQLDVIVLQVAAGGELEAANQAQKIPGVAFAELDYQVSVDDVLATNTPAGMPGLAASSFPDDPYYPQQWSLPKIGAPSAWKTTTGSPGVLIAVVDSGVQLTHPDLAENIWTNPGEIAGNHLDDDGNGKVDDVHGWRFYHLYTNLGFVPAEDANVVDDLGHGTHVAGISAAVGNNQTGIAGLAWDGRIMPVKVLDQYGNGWYSDIAAGMIYAADNGAQVINLSLGGETSSELLRRAVEYAHGRGALVIAAAGNSNGAVLYPAAYEPALAVAASDENDLRPTFSNFGPTVDLAAPGTNIYSTWYRGNYFTKSGTSMAAPHVSGVAALVWSYNPSLTADQVAGILMHSAVDIDPPGVDIYTGWGRLSAIQALDLVLGTTIYLPVIRKN